MSTPARTVVIGAAALLTCAWFAGVSISGDTQHPELPPPPPQLAPLSALEGDWEGAGSEHHEGMSEKVTVCYRVTSGGSAVVETLSPGTEHEMVSVYYVDAGKLVLTHYCMLGNQPMLTAQDDAAPDSIHFVCHGGGNIPDENVPHMHEVTHKFIDPSHLQSTWVYYNEGKPASSTVFDFHRVHK